MKACRMLDIALIGLLVGFSLGWWVQGLRMEETVAKLQLLYQRAVVVQVEQARQEEQTHFSKIQEAEREATLRSQRQEVIAQSAVAESDRLRNELSEYRDRLSSLTESTVRETAVVVGELLGECSGEYQSMADKAQRHADDVRTLLAAWPVQVSKEQR